jgi:hypothetical protein
MEKEVFRELSAACLIEQEWGLVGFKNKEGVEIQTGPLEFTAEEGSDC